MGIKFWKLYELSSGNVQNNAIVATVVAIFAFVPPKWQAAGPAIAAELTFYVGGKFG